MKVKVRSIALIRTLLGSGELEVDLPSGATIEDLISRLVGIGGPAIAPYLAPPKEESAHAPLRIMVNGRDITVLEGRRTVLTEGDDVLVFIPIAGG